MKGVWSTVFQILHTTMCQCHGAKQARGRGSRACRTYLLLTLVVMMLLALAHLLLVSQVISTHYNSLNCVAKEKLQLWLLEDVANIHIATAILVQ